MPAILYKSILQPREVIEPYKYFSEDLEYLLKKGSTLEHYDSKGRIIFEHKYFKGLLKDRDFKEESFDKLFRKTVNLDCDKSKQDIEKLKSMSSYSPIIIGGCGRSGTTLLLSILSSNSKVFGIRDELYSFYPSFRPKKIINHLEDNNFKSSKVWCEKTPKNILNFKKIYKAFNEKVKLIHIVRDGRDVVTSEHPFHPNKYWVDKDRWVSDVNAGLKFPYGILVKYEDLVFNTENELLRICNFCGLDYESSMLNFHQTSTIKKNVAWSGEKVSKINQTRIKRWKNDKHKHIINAFNNDLECLSLLSKLNYE